MAAQTQTIAYRLWCILEKDEDGPEQPLDVMWEDSVPGHPMIKKVKQRYLSSFMKQINQTVFAMHMSGVLKTPRFGPEIVDYNKDTVHLVITQTDVEIAEEQARVKAASAPAPKPPTIITWPANDPAWLKWCEECKRDGTDPCR